MSDQYGQDFLSEALDAPQEQGAVPAQPVAQRPVAAPTGGYTPLIAAKRKELDELQKRYEEYETNDYYMKRGANGQEYFDGVAHQKDGIVIGRLARELDDLLRKQDEANRLLSHRAGQAREMARSVFQREMASARVSDAEKKAIAEEFAKVFQTIPASEWARPMYADRSVMDTAVVQLIETAAGRLRRQQWSGAAPSGLDGEAPGMPAAEEEEDDLMNNMMYALDNRVAGSMSIADRRRAEAARQKEGGQR